MKWYDVIVLILAVYGGLDISWHLFRWAGRWK